MNKKHVLKTVIAMLIVLSFASAAYATSTCSIDPATFADVPHSHWAQPFVENAYSNKLVSGVGDNRFDPEKNIANAEWIQMIAKTLWADMPKDSSDPWWKNAFDWASSNFVIKGTTVNNIYLSSKNVYPNNAILATINRYDMALTVYNIVFESKLLTIKDVEKVEVISKISDYNTIPDRYKKAVEYCYKTGFITGVDSLGTFAGDKPMTRASAAVVITRLLSAKNNTWILPSEVSKINQRDNPVKNMIQMTDQFPESKPGKFYSIKVDNTIKPGKLSNGNDINDENIKAMFDELQVMFPESTEWGMSNKGKIQYSHSTKHPAAGAACNAWASMVGDVVFGKGAKWTKRTDFENIKVGDMVQFIDSSNESRHWAVVSNVREIEKEDGTKVKALIFNEGNYGSRVTWEAFRYSNSLRDSSRPKTVFYSAY